MSNLRTVKFFELGPRAPTVVCTLLCTFMATVRLTMSLVSSVTRFDHLRKLLVTNFLTKIAKIFGNFLGYSGNITFK